MPQHRERFWPLLGRHVSAAIYRRTRRYRVHRAIVGDANVLPTPALAERLSWWLAQRLPDAWVARLGSARLLRMGRAAAAVLASAAPVFVALWQVGRAVRRLLRAAKRLIRRASPHEPEHSSPTSQQSVAPPEDAPPRSGRSHPGRYGGLAPVDAARRAARASAGFGTLGAVLEQRAAGKRVIAFDVFDTLLVRCVHPERIKDLTARRLARRLNRMDDWPALRDARARLESEMGRENEAAGRDHEFALRDMLQRWIALGPAPNAELARELAAAELEFERCATRPAPHMHDVLAQLHASGRRLVFASDMYLAADDIRSLLRQHGLERYFAAGYVSSELGVTKRSGRLFEELLRRERIGPGELLFIGDNPHSDFDAPGRLGIAAVHLWDAAELARRTRLHLLDELAGRNPYWGPAVGEQAIQFAAERCGGAARRPGRATSPHEELGGLLAPVFLAFARYILEQCRVQQLDRLVFLSREGMTFMRLCRRLVRATGERAALPPCSYAAVSRRATFLPSMARLDWPEIERIWRQYARQSLRLLLHNLSLPGDEFLPLAERCGLTDHDGPIESPAACVPLYRFLADADVQERFARHRDAARAMLRDHLAAKGLFDSGRVGLVDIGWRGSIQDNIVRALSNDPALPELHGLYVGLTGPGDELPRSHKHAFLADARRGDWLEEVVFKNGPVFEMFSTAPHGAVEGYQRDPRRPGGVRPIVRARESERRNLAGSFREVFRGMRAALDAALAVAPLLPTTSAAEKPWLVERLRRYILYPTRTEARAFLSYSHAENFGVQHDSTYEVKASLRHILAGTPWGLPRRMIVALQREFWPEGFLARRGPPLANLAYDLLETRYGARNVRPPARAPRPVAADALPAEPRVAIVIPCYNHGLYLPEAIATARAQTHRNIEIIVVDDGSTDEATCAALARFEREGVRVLRQPNQGLAGARNAGVRASEAPFYVPLDADDRIEADFVAKLLPALRDDPRIGYAYSQAQLFGAESRLWRCPDYDPRNLVIENLSTATAVVRRAAFDAAGGYSRDMTDGYEDWDFWLALNRAGFAGRCVPLPLFCYRKHAQNASMLARLGPHRDAMILHMIRHHREQFENALLPPAAAARGADEQELLRQHRAMQAIVEAERADSCRMLLRLGPVGRRLAVGVWSRRAAERLLPTQRLARLQGSLLQRVLRLVKGSALHRRYARWRYGQPAPAPAAPPDADASSMAGRA